MSAQDKECLPRGGGCLPRVGRCLPRGVCLGGVYPGGGGVCLGRCLLGRQCNVTDTPPGDQNDRQV